MKCDKQSPCDSCTKAGIAASCKFLRSHQKGNDKNESKTTTVDASERNEGVKRHQHVSIQSTTTPNSSRLEMEQEIMSLKSKIKSLESLLKQYQNNTHPSHDSDSTEQSPHTQSILDIKLDSLNTNLIATKPGRTGYYGAFLSISNCASNISINTFLVFAKFLDKERNAYKQVHGTSPHIPSLINATVDDAELARTIEIKIAPITDVLIERISYFDHRLNDLLYNGFVDVPHVFDSIYTFFTLDEITGRYTFKPPTNISRYADLSMIFAIVPLTFPFCDTDSSLPQSLFLSLEVKSSIIKASTDALSLSQFQRRTSYSALISLVLLKDYFLSYSESGTDSMDKAKSSMMTTLIVDLGFRTGLHRDPKSIKNILYRKGSKLSTYTLPLPNSQTLWAYLEQLDASTSVFMGTPFRINDAFSDTHMPSFTGCEASRTFTNLLRETSLLVNSAHPLSLRDALLLRRKYVNLNCSLESLDSLIIPRDSFLQHSNLASIAHEVSLKLKIFGVLLVLDSYLLNILTDDQKYPSDQLTLENRDLLKQISRKTEIDFTQLSITVWKFWKDLSDGVTVFGKDNNFYIIYFQQTLLPVLRHSIIMFVIGVGCHIMASITPLFSRELPDYYKESESNTEYGFEIVSLDSLNICDTETSLIKDLLSSEDSTVSESTPNLFNCPKQICAFFCEIHRAASKNMTFSSNYGYFCLLKLLCIFACFTDSMCKVHSLKSNDTGKTFKEILDSTKKKVEETMKVGIVDLGFNLQVDDQSIQNMLNSVFTEEVFSSILGDTMFNMSKEFGL
ncbi:unnamed protein product [Ambrosiozyma monospora]|uniref:Unnamed protein product n=1 Tax=Ambrosiozyma monospora TaxID=43982 RepID=A0ACB5SVJ2_AMBMO|nr:unnamed protein product [Ambrosiozyma monospora]